MLKVAIIILAVLTLFYIFSELSEAEHELKLRFSEHKGVETALVIIIPIILFIIVSRDNIIDKLLN